MKCFLCDLGILVFFCHVSNHANPDLAGKFWSLWIHWKTISMDMDCHLSPVICGLNLTTLKFIQEIFPYFFQRHRCRFGIFLGVFEMKLIYTEAECRMVFGSDTLKDWAALTWWWHEILFQQFHFWELSFMSTMRPCLLLVFFHDICHQMAGEWTWLFDLCFLPWLDSQSTAPLVPNIPKIAEHACRINDAAVVTCSGRHWTR